MDRLGLPRELPLDDANAPELDLAQLSGRAQRLLGLNLLLSFYISEDVRNTSRNRMMVRICTRGRLNIATSPAGKTYSRRRKFQNTGERLISNAGVLTNLRGTRRAAVVEIWMGCWTGFEFAEWGIAVGWWLGNEGDF